MTIEIQAEKKARYLHIRCRGEYRPGALLDVYKKAFRMAEREGMPGVLIDIRDLGGDPPTLMERFEQSNQVAEMQVNSGKRIGIVIVGREPMIDPERFGETVALNRGATGGVFTDLNAAVAWIEKFADE
jgi:hypothetical protein